MFYSLCSQNFIAANKYQIKALILIIAVRGSITLSELLHVPVNSYQYSIVYYCGINNYVIFCPRFKNVTMVNYLVAPSQKRGGDGHWHAFIK